ncbi:Flp pilus assembly protein TadG [Nakamurella sp. UYEF19]|uniref:hypothetical protein n=1 Tax=Nakamurella sp. UYEF19 TaxID=1756392 RepID=UPI00339B9B6D
MRAHRSPARSRWFGPVELTTPPVINPGSNNRPTEHDDGRAIIEVIFLAVLILIPVVYILISLIRLQATTFAVTQAARDAGRAIDSAPTIADGIDRAQQIAAIDLADQNVAAASITLQFIAPGTECTSANQITPTLEPGAAYDLCVTAVVTLPGVPTVLTGDHNTVTGVYSIRISELREGR